MNIQMNWVFQKSLKEVRRRKSIDVRNKRKSSQQTKAEMGAGKDQVSSRVGFTLLRQCYRKRRSDREQKSGPLQGRGAQSDVSAHACRVWCSGATR